MRGSAYLSILIMAAMIVVVISALRMEFTSSKVLPLALAGVVLVLQSVQLSREVLGHGGPEVAEGEDSQSWRNHLAPLGWLFGFGLFIVVLGFIVAIPMLALAYGKTHRMRWLTTIVLAVAAPALVYGVFEIALGVPLYRGLLFGARA